MVPIRTVARWWVLVVVLVAAREAAAEPSAATVDYVIRARLDPAEHVVEGEETVRLVNHSRGTVDRLTFHLYLNGFASDATLWMRESGGELRGATISDYGSIRVTALSAQGRSLLADARTDETLLHVPLPRAVPPGGSVDVDVAFRAKLPSAFARTGWARDFHMVAQWFPKLARLGEDGRFLSRPFHANQEFHADFGDYEVTIDVPRAQVVGATGERIAAQTHGDRAVLVYRARRVHDFAWTASPRFVERTVTEGSVRIRSLAMPGQETAVDRQLGSIREGLVRYGRWLGEYPYPTLTVVSPPEDAIGAGGMEYPTLIATGSRWPSIPGVRLPEEVALHELAHQWFYGLCASNEPDEAWLDEGLTQYATGQLMEQLYGRRGPVVDLFGVRVGYGTVSRVVRALAPAREPVARPAWEFATATSYGAHVYFVTDLLLRTLGGRLGSGRVNAAIGRYARRQRFSHPTTADLVRSLEADLGPEAVADLVDPVLHTGARWNVAVRRIETTQVPGDRHGRWRTRVLVVREGEVVEPVRVDVELAGGARTSLAWDGRSRHRWVEVVGDEPGVAARVDRRFALPLDEDLTDNALAARGEAGSTFPLWTRLVYAAQTLLAVLGP